MWKTTATTPATREYSSRFSFWCSRYSRVLSHVSFWCCKYSRVLSHFSFRYRRYSRLLKSFKRFGTPGTRGYSSHFSGWYSRYSLVLSHFSFWYCRYSRTLSYFSSWYSRHSRVLSFQLLVPQVLASTQVISFWCSRDWVIQNDWYWYSWRPTQISISSFVWELSLLYTGIRVRGKSRLNVHVPATWYLLVVVSAHDSSGLPILRPSRETPTKIY